MKNITEKLQNLWSLDEVRILVLSSLGIQIGLIFLAPLRKHNTNIMLALMLWLFYVASDNVAILGLGTISRQTPAGSGVSSELTVLWASFLLVHLGGPDTITSFSIEDNELWLRHLWGLLYQVIITVYVFFQLPRTCWLWIPTIFVFIPGLIKFAERTHALRIASKDYIRGKIISELRIGSGNRPTEVSRETTPSTTGQANETKGFWGNLMGSIKSVFFPPEDTIDILVSSFTDISEDKGEAILEGFRWFNTFKCLLVDVTFDADLLMKSQDRFSYLSSTDALRLVAIELSFLYDYLHTKAVHMHCILGRALRYFSLVSIIAAFVVFHHLDMQKYVSGDIIITYILFGVGLSLEVIATILLVISDWTVMALKRTQHSEGVVGCITALVKAILMNGKPRWACTIGHFNLVDFCLRDRDTVLAKIMRILEIKIIWDNMRESKLIPIPDKLVEIMVTAAKRRALNVHTYKVLVEARAYRGKKTLECYYQLERLEWSMKREFDESIILWHLATDICYYEDEPSNNPNGEKQESSSQPNGENQEPSDPPEREVSMKTSNYMMYLLTQQQSMMQLGYGKTRFEATCAAVKNKFKDKGKLYPREARKELMKKVWVPPPVGQKEVVPPSVGQKEVVPPSVGQKEVVPPSVGQNELVSANGSQPTNQMDILGLKKIWANLRQWGTSVLKKWANLRQWGTSVLKEIWANLRQWGTSVLKKIWENLGRCTPPALKNWFKRKRDEDKRKREDEDEWATKVLNDVLRLAKELHELEPEKKWKLISETWMEMLGYAAIHCDSYQHAKSLSRGGELLTHLWLLMSQLGVVEEHKMQQYQSGTV